MSIAKLILIKHAEPEIVPEAPSSRWVLSAEGRARCRSLANGLRTQRVRRLYCSLEPKALETAALVAVELGLEVHPQGDLHENDRTGQGYVSVDEITSRIRRFFAEAVGALMAEASDQTVAVVTHGTVMTTLITANNAIDPFVFWESLSLPSYVVLAADSLKMEGVAHTYQVDQDLPAGA